MGKKTKRRTKKKNANSKKDATTGSTSSTISSSPDYKADFDRRKVMEGVSESDAYGIYALSIYVEEPDIQTLIADALTAGSNDKNADFIYIEEDTARAFIGQSYLSTTWGKHEAPAKKAASLGTAVTWLLETPIDDVPATLRLKASELREALKNETITEICILYTHNCHECKNVREELDAVARTTKAICGSQITVLAHELGIDSLTKLFDAMDKEILVTDKVSFDLPEGHYEINGPKWKAIASAITGEKFHQLYKKYKDDLYSANIRSYLGLLKQKKGNINANIRETIKKQPEDFWAFNNGITVLTNGYKLQGNKLVASGISIINGAQTTGVLGDSDSSDVKNSMVPCRFIKCGDSDTIAKIITYNNTQNAVKSFDRRSNDRTQALLKDEFQNLQIDYIHRRTQSRRAPAGSIHVETVGQGLASFHNLFQKAIRQRSLIFEEDSTYTSVFPVNTSIGHVYLVQCLLDAIDELKLEYRKRASKGNITKLQTDYLELLEYSTGKQFIVFVVGRVADQIIGKKIADLHKWRVNSDQIKPDRSEIVSAWKEVLVGIVPKIARFIRDDPQKAVRSTDLATEAGDDLADFLEAQGEDVDAKFKKIRALTTTG
ncbi:MAG: AIPR family protein [Phycisphaerales bacterium]